MPYSVKNHILKDLVLIFHFNNPQNTPLISKLLRKMCFLNIPCNSTFSCFGSCCSLCVKVLSFSILCVSPAYSSSSRTTSYCFPWLLRAKFLNLSPAFIALIKVSTTVQKPGWDRVTGVVEVVRWQRQMFSIVLY